MKLHDGHAGRSVGKGAWQFGHILGSCAEAEADAVEESRVTAEVQKAAGGRHTRSLERFRRWVLNDDELVPVARARLLVDSLSVERNDELRRVIMVAVGVYEYMTSQPPDPLTTQT